MHNTLFSVIALVVALQVAVARGQTPHGRAPLSDATLRAVQANNRFAFSLFNEVGSNRSAEENMLLSPLSVSTALAMTYAGARGDTASQFEAALQWQDLGAEVHLGLGALITDLNMDREGYDLQVANRLFGQGGYPFHRDFLDTLSTGYGAPLEKVDFSSAPEAARGRINEWVEDQTNDRIRDLLPEGSVTPDSRLVLANALYFNGDWKQQFKAEDTYGGQFTGADGSTVASEVMSQNAHFRYGEFDDFKMLEMAYAGDDLSMVVMLPDDPSGLQDMAASLTADAFAETVGSLSNEFVSLKLPKFEFADSAELAAPLKDMGLQDAFTASADFTGIADDDLHIDGVFHKTFIAVDEMGTEAAAATGVVIGTTSVPLEPELQFHANHAFLFAIRDVHSGAIMFLGRVNEPGVWSASAASVPEPSSVVLLAAGVVAVLFRRRRR